MKFWKLIIIQLVVFSQQMSKYKNYSNKKLFAQKLFAQKFRTKKSKLIEGIEENKIQTIEISKKI